MKGRGFTLVELIVVIGIISLLSSIVLASLGNARAKARDARRLLDMHNIRTGLELYKSKYERYPSATITGNDCGGFDNGYNSDAGDTTFIQSLVSDGIFGQTPGDPLSTGGCSVDGYLYKYDRNTAGSAGAHGCPKNFYLIAIKNMETWKDEENPHPSSPGFICNGYDFLYSGGVDNDSPQFDWLAGDFE